MKRGAEHPAGLKLSPRAQAHLDELVRTLGVRAAARRLGVALTCVDRLAFGGSVRSEAVRDRVEAACSL